MSDDVVDLTLDDSEDDQPQTQPPAVCNGAPAEALPLPRRPLNARPSNHQTHAISAAPLPTSRLHGLDLPPESQLAEGRVAELAARLQQRRSAAAAQPPAQRPIDTCGDEHEAEDRQQEPHSQQPQQQGGGDVEWVPSSQASQGGGSGRPAAAGGSGANDRGSRKPRRTREQIAREAEEKRQRK